MSLGKFVCVEKKIDKGRWRWAVTLFDECLAGGVVGTQAACRAASGRVKAEYLAKNNFDHCPRAGVNGARERLQ